jgi:hypothetical protein
VAWDSEGYTAISATFTIVVYNLPSPATPTATPASGKIDFGQVVVFMAHPSGGSGGYHYAWSGLPSGCVSADAVILACIPLAPGFNVDSTFTVAVTVTDSNGGGGTSPSLAYTVDSDPVIHGSGQLTHMATIPTGPYPWGIYVNSSTTIDPETNIAYVVDSTADTVTVISLVHDTVLRSFPVPGGVISRSAWFDDRTGLLWVAGTLFDVLALNGVTGAVVYDISLPHTLGSNPDPSEFAYDPSDDALWVTEFETSLVSEISLVTNTLNASLDTGPNSYPSSIALDDSTHLAFITDTYYSEVHVLNVQTHTFLTPVTISTLPYSTVAVDPIKHMVYVTGEGSGQIHAFSEFTYMNPGAIISSPANGEPFGVALDPKLGLVFVGDVNGGHGQFFCMDNLAPVATTGISFDWSFHVAFDTDLDLAVIDATGISPNSVNGIAIWYVGGLAGMCPNYQVEGIPYENNLGSDPDVGQTTTLQATVTGGSGNYSFVWSGLPTGCASQDSILLNCTPTTAGVYDITLNVTDSNNMSVMSGVLYYIVSTDPTVSIPTASPASVDVGQLATFSVTTSGGSGGNSYFWSGLPSGCTSSDAATLSCAISAVGTYRINVTVTDSNGFVVQSPVLTFVVNTDPTVAEPTPSSDSFGVGQSFTLSVTASGGSGVYAFAWDISDTGLGCTLANAATITCVPTEAGSYDASVAATDTSGYSVTSSALELMVIDWNYGNLCSVSKGNCQFTGSAHCAPALAYSFNGSYEALSVGITGSSDCVYLNISGSHDVINVRVTGSSMPYLQIIMAGTSLTSRSPGAPTRRSSTSSVRMMSTT